jgi:hypothetical protein
MVKDCEITNLNYDCGHTEVETELCADATNNNDGTYTPCGNTTTEDVDIEAECGECMEEVPQPPDSDESGGD